MRKRMMLGIAGLASVALVGGTFAYFTQTTTIDNPFNTATYKSVVTEDFNPDDGDKWKPGAEVNKDLYVQNTGDRPVVLRVSFEDIWSRNGSEFHTPGTYQSMLIWQQNTTDGDTEGDSSVVHKIFAEGAKPGAVGSKWSGIQTDGYCYYMSKLEPGETTGKFLDSVKLDAETDMGKYWTEYFYAIGPKGEQPLFDPEDKNTWTSVKKEASSKDGNGIRAFDVEALEAAFEGDSDALAKLHAKLADGKVKADESIYTTAQVYPDPEHPGYSGADYILRIRIEMVQATDEAVRDVFGEAGIATYAQSIYDNWDLESEALTTEVSTETETSESESSEG